MNRPSRAARYSAMIFFAATLTLASPAQAADQIRVGKAQGTAWTFLPVDIAIAQDFFAKQNLDPGYVAEEEARVTRGWRRLQELPALGLAIVDYPLPEVRQRWQEQNEETGTP